MLNKIIRFCLFYSGTRWCPRCIAFDNRIYCEKEQLGGFLWRTFYYADVYKRQIQDCKFKTFGCGAAVATSSMATELVKGKTIQEALEVTNKAVMEALDGLPPVKVHCSLLAEEAIHAALWDYAEKHNIKIEGLSKPKSDISEGETEEEEY